MVPDLVSLGSNLPIIDEMYEQYLDDPASVDASWRALFDDPSSSSPQPSGTAHAAGTRRAADNSPSHRPSVSMNATPSSVRQSSAASTRGLSVWPLINAHRVRGHLAADLDPLGLMERPGTIELDPSSYGFTEADADRVFPAAGLHGVEQATLREIMSVLRDTYCGSIGVQFMHISSPVKKAWLADHMERMHQLHEIDADTRRHMLRLVIAAETLEHFCHIKYPGTKRFSIEGGEGLIPILDAALTYAAQHGCIEAVVGMAHRGRLNTLVHAMGRAPRLLFAEFEDVEPEVTMGGGDVKYHLGYSSDRVDRNGREMHLSLSFNPSHLEAIDPVVMGRVRAKQLRHSDWDHSKVMGLLIHGDAAFAGQGLVAETLNLCNLHGYRTGGTTHIIVNNQIGFTASPKEARSTPYCTDIAKMIECPIFHVNGDDVDAMIYTMKIAMEYRAQFKNDIIIDMICYRLFGHNEMDEPAFTQPQMYERIRGKRRISEIYSAKLIAEGIVTQAEVDEMRAREKAMLEQELALGRAAVARPKIAAMSGVWSQYKGGHDRDVPEADTTIDIDRLSTIAERITSLPDEILAHPKVERLLGQRAQMGRDERPVDWGMAELLAYGSLLWDGVDVRITGQDSSRGTFSHRHAAIVDMNDASEYMLLGHLHDDQGLFRVYDSPVTEAGILGFEFGFSLDYPDGLVIWEAQFGDFANGAQVIFDQFIFASEDKWERLSGLTMLLPHGYEGQGPEHSSARIERFLQAAAEDNIQVCQPSNVAQMFHLLRRQVLRAWRKPLVIMTPKSLLRLPAATSTMVQLATGRFERVLADPQPPPADAVERVFLCSGRVYYDLVKERAARGDTRTAIVRLEQLYPWRDELILDATTARFANAREFVWVQDEPSNMGALTFVVPRLRALYGADIRCVSRVASASPATGSHRAHVIEQQLLMDDAFTGPSILDEQSA